MTQYTDADLRVLDAAERELTEDQRQRAQATLRRIMTTPPATDDGNPDWLPRRAPRRRPARAVALLAAAAAVVVATVVLPGLGATSNAYATWTAEPSPVAAADLAAVTTACRDMPDPGRQPGELDVRTIPVALAERRGDLVTVLFYQDIPETAVACVAVNVAGTTDVDDVNISVGGSSGPAWTPPAREITQGSIGQFGTHPVVSVTQGAVGAGVVAVTIHSGSQAVKATIENGRYAAWWPGPAFDPATDDAGPKVNLTYDVTLEDGTVIESASPYIPSPKTLAAPRSR